MRPARALLLALLLTAPAAARADDERGSLEDLLRRARAEREGQASALLGEVQALLVELETLSGRSREREAARRRRRLLDLGPEVAPLLVPHLDPGADPSEEVTFRTRQVVRVLRELRSPAITDALIARTGVGTIDGRLNALAVLETCPEPLRAGPPVRDLYRVATGRLRTGALLALARLGGPESEVILSEALDDADPALVDLALRALAEVPSAGVAGQVLELVKDSDRGPLHVQALTVFYGARRELFDQQDHFIELVQLLAHPEVPRDEGVALLDRLTQLDLKVRLAVRKAMDPLTQHSNQQLREAALVLLARAGDNGAKRDLLRPYHDKINDQRDFDVVYTERGDVLYRIGEYAQAIKDYKQAVSLMRARTKVEDPFVGLARCYAQMRKFKDASDYLVAAPISMARRRELAADPAFVEMLESRYRATFLLPEDEEDG